MFVTHRAQWLAQPMAIAGALLWGLIEVVALWRSRRAAR